MLPGVVTPQARVHNYGSVRTPTTVVFEISGASFYNSLVDLPEGLPVAADTVISFGDWTAEPGSYVAACSTWTGGDQRPVNDVVSAPFTVGGRDVGVIGIIEPTGALTDSVLVYPKARVKNFGNFAAQCTLHFTIDDGTFDRGGKSSMGKAAVHGSPVRADAVLCFEPALLRPSAPVPADGRA